MTDTSKSKETTSDMMGCDGMPESKPAIDGHHLEVIGKQEFYQECIKNSKYLELLKEYAAQNEEVQHFVDEIEKE
eukprot:1400005-Ditylum_brightwellii.AAC.1